MWTPAESATHRVEPSQQNQLTRVNNHIVKASSQAMLDSIDSINEFNLIKEAQIPN